MGGGSTRRWPTWDGTVEDHPPDRRDARNIRVQRDFDVEAIRTLKQECHLFLNPLVVGGGKPARDWQPGRTVVFLTRGPK